MNEVVLGIDPGINTTGYAVIRILNRSCSIVDKGYIRPPKGRPFARRLSFLYESVLSILEDFRPTVVVVEEIYSHISYPYTSVLMGHARGVIFLAIDKASARLQTISASRVKKAIAGRGNASKEQIRGVLKQLYGLGEEFDAYPLDVSDALALATGYVFLTKRK